MHPQQKPHRRAYAAWLILSVTLVLLVPLVTAVASPRNEGGRLFLPTIITCTFSPTVAPASPEALIRVTPGGGIIASTFNPDSIVITNQSAEGTRIQSVQIDLSSAVLPDIAFDPNGGAGDNIAKDVQVNTDTGVGYVGRTYDQPLDGGFQMLNLEFGEFDPGETFGFSVDIDPTSIKGGSSPGPNDSGSVSGLEMSAAQITVTFETDSGTETYTTTLHPIPGNDSEGRALVRNSLPPAPVLDVVGIDTPAVTAESTALVRVTGQPGSIIQLWTLEAGLFTEGIPGGGFDLDPFEANSVIAIRVTEQDQCIGTVTVSVPLLRGLPEAGLNHLFAVQTDTSGLISPTSNVEIVEFVP